MMYNEYIRKNMKESATYRSCWNKGSEARDSCGEVRMICSMVFIVSFEIIVESSHINVVC